MAEGFLPVPGPFRLGDTLTSGQVFRWRPLGPWWHGLVGAYAVALRPAPGGLRLRCQPPDVPVVEGLLRRYFRLQDDLEGVFASIGQDPHIARAWACYRGLRLVHTDPWEALVSFLCSPMSSIGRISAVLEDISRLLGSPLRLELEGEVVVRHTLPGPEALAQAGEGFLRGLGLGFRAPWLAGAARAVASGRLDLHRLQSLPTEEVRRALMSLPGVGEKVADCVLLYGFGRTGCFPVDVWVQRALAQWYFNGRCPPYRRLQEWARERFGPWAGYAQLYLYHHRRLLGRAGLTPP